MSYPRMSRNLPFRVFSTLKVKRPPLAFAFDIDGVLVRGERALPEAQRALRILDGNNPFRVKIPFILMTNGGGVAEAERCRRLSLQLDHPVHERQYIQAHTVLRTMAHKYRDQSVLVLGGTKDTVRRVAESYGFHNVFTTLDVLAWNPAVWPFYSLQPAEKDTAKYYVDFSNQQISAIFVFHDPRNWALDIQIICDIILSGGFVGGPFVNPSMRKTELIFCNPDLLWRSDFAKPRLGQGAFKEAFQSVFKALTGTPYPHVQFGKPTQATYEFAEGVLAELLAAEGFSGPLPPLYMVGDNPESDIAGAQQAGWQSILVHTGVYDPVHGPPKHTPSFEAVDVENAVSLAIRNEFEKAKQEDPGYNQ